MPPSTAATVSAELCVAAAETPAPVVGVPIVVTPDGSPMIALVSGSVYSSLVCAAKRGSTGGGPSQPLSAVAPTMAVAAIARASRENRFLESPDPLRASVI